MWQAQRWTLLSVLFCLISSGGLAKSGPSHAVELLSGMPEQSDVPYNSLLGPNITQNIDFKAEKEAIAPAIVAEVMPVFFARASKVVIQLVRDHLSKAFLGSFETYADGNLSSCTCHVEATSFEYDPR